MESRGIAAFALLVVVLGGGETYAEPEQAGVPKRLSPAQAADAVVEAFRAKDEAALTTLAQRSPPDPWLVAAELDYRDEHDAATAFANAASGKTVAGLASYVASRRGKNVPVETREALVAAVNAMAERNPAAALGALPAGLPADSVIGVRIANWRGIALRALDRQEDSTAAYVVAAEGAERLGWLDRAGRAFDAAGRLQNALGNRDRALALFERGLAAMEAIEFPAGIAALLVNMGIVHHDRLHFARALRCYERALPSMEASGHQGGLAETLLRIGLASNALGNYPKALLSYQRSLPIRLSLGDRVGWSGAHINLGNVYHSLCNYPKALEHYDIGLAEARKIGHLPWAANALNGMAGVYRALGNYTRALELVEQSLDLRKASGDTTGTAHALNNLGIVYQDLGRLPEATVFYTRALEAARTLGQRRIESDALYSTGRIHLEEGRSAEAIELFELSLAMSKELGDRAAVAWRIASIGTGRIQLGNIKAGLADLQRAEREARRLRERRLLVWCLGGQAETYLKEGNPARAMYLAREARTEVEYLLGGLGAEEASSVRGTYAALFAAGTLAATRLEETAEAVTFIESGRAGALLEQLGGRDALRWTDVPEVLRQAELDAKVAEVEAQTAYREAVATGKRDTIRAAAETLDVAQSAVRAVAERIHREAKGQVADLFYPRAATIEELQASLEPGQALVLYAFCLGEATAVVLTSESGQVVALGEEAVVRAAVADATLWDPEVDASQALADLRRLLVSPLALPKSAKQVLVSPEGPLCYVPFNLLFEACVTFTPSGTTHTLLASEIRPRGERVLALGDPVYDAEAREDRAHGVYVRGGPLVPLPSTRLEVEAIGDEILLGPDANEARLRARLLEKGRWRALHFACHGLVDRERPTLSSLALSPVEGEDGFLTALEVLRMDVPADLAVLSACETGTGRIVPGEGIVGLTRAFMYAGAPRVLCSLWKVDDQATRALMEKFYELWHPLDGEGIPAAEALSQAQAHVRAHDQWRHPYFWAAWVLWGLPD